MAAATATEVHPDHRRLVNLDAEIFELHWALRLITLAVEQRGWRGSEWAEMTRLARAKNAAEAERLQLVRGVEASHG